MSIWGPTPIENDDAADWVADLEENPRLEVVADALSEIADPAHVGYREIPECCEAVAAAQVLTELLGMSPVEPDLTPETARTLAAELERQDLGRTRKLLEDALVAVRIVSTDDENSELRQVWDEDPEQMTLWAAAMADLENRLRALAARVG